MRIGRASSLAAAKTVSSSACLRTFWLIRVVGRSPAVWIVGNSSASMPLTWVANRPARMWSVSAPWSSRSTRSGAGQRADEVGQQARRHRGRAVGLDLAGDPVGDADLEVGRGQLEAGVLGPEEDVCQHGQGASAGDRPGHDRQAARQVLLHDREFHVGCLQGCRQADGRAVPGVGDPGDPARAGVRGRVVSWVDWLVSIFSFHHHRHIAVDVVDGDARPCGARLLAGSRLTVDAGGRIPVTHRGCERG